MDTALVVNFKMPFPGRERQALDYASEVDGYWGRLASEGKCSPPESFFFETGHGLWVVKGERDTLLALQAEEATQRLIIKGELLLQDFSAEIVKTGTAAQEYLLRYAGVGQELALV